MVRGVALLPLLVGAALADVDLNCQIFDDTMICDNDKERLHRAERLGQGEDHGGYRDLFSSLPPTLEAERHHAPESRHLPTRHLVPGMVS